jgi:tRNA (cmo5U34)-methyltransferase
LSTIYTAEWAEAYTQRAEASIPGRDGLYRICAACLAGIPEQGRVLVVGCGTGEELVRLAKAFPKIRLVGLDPAEPMLDICRRRVHEAGLNERVELICGLLSDARLDGTFSAATSVLVAQHLDAGEALDFFTRIAQRLTPGGILFTADLHIADGQDRDQMLALWRVQGEHAGIDPGTLDGMLERFTTDIRPRDEADIHSLLRQANFTDIRKPFASLLYGAWCARTESRS